MLSTLTTILSFPFWFAAFLFVFCGMFGTISVNGVKVSDGAIEMKMRAVAVAIGLGLTGVAYFLTWL